jgi:hypothetical protein
MLPMAKYAYNNSITLATAMLLFMLTMGIILELPTKQKRKYEIVGHKIM